MKNLLVEYLIISSKDAYCPGRVNIKTHSWVVVSFFSFQSLRSQVSIDTKNCNFQVGIDTNFWGGGVNLAQKVKRRVFGLWVGIINVDRAPVLYC